MASTCLHGFAPGSCLICQTLQGATTPTATKQASASRPPGRTASTSPVPLGPVQPETTGNGRRSAGRRSRGPRLLGLAVVVVLALIGAWIVLHLVFAVLHILELIGVALIAGYLGYAFGVFHGRRTAGRR